ncbi:MAG: hypothetical protein M3434_13990 [Gemmatimonadota bacterium]|nr:hypothetical protein [Gemmatimonadota bacterium]
MPNHRSRRCPEVVYSRSAVVVLLWLLSLPMQLDAQVAPSLGEPGRALDADSLAVAQRAGRAAANERGVASYVVLGIIGGLPIGAGVLYAASGGFFDDDPWGSATPVIGGGLLVLGVSAFRASQPPRDLIYRVQHMSAAYQDAYEASYRKRFRERRWLHLLAGGVLGAGLFGIGLVAS